MLGGRLLFEYIQRGHHLPPGRGHLALREARESVGIVCPGERRGLRARMTAFSSASPPQSTVPVRRWPSAGTGTPGFAAAVAGELAGGGSLAAVGCPPQGSSATCWAVGQTVGKGSGLIPIHPLIERWKGGALTVVDSPPGGRDDYPELRAVACANKLACQAVGSRGSGEDDAMVLTEGWNGSTWSRETSPSPLYGFRTLSGVACPSAKDCWAVGEGLIRSGEGTRMVIEHF